MPRPATRTREALLEKGALLFARHGVDGVTARELHEAIGARNESALHYHFGDKAGLVAEIIRGHLSAIETRRATLVAAIAAEDRSGDLRSLVHAFAAPMAEDLESPVGRAHLRLVARLSHPALAYVREPFRVISAPAGSAAAKWLMGSLSHLPARVRAERLAAFRAQLISLFGLRAQLLDDGEIGHEPGATELFLENLLDMLVAGLSVPPSESTLRATRRRALSQSK